jgi:hypothetical protein
MEICKSIFLVSDFCAFHSDDNVVKKKEMIISFYEFRDQRFFLAQHHQHGPSGKRWIGSLDCALILKGLT